MIAWLAAAAIAADEGAPELHFVVQPMIVLTEEDGGFESDVALRRAKVALSGTYAAAVGYRIQVDPARWTRDQDFAAALDDAWVDLRFDEALVLRVGQFKVPYSAQWLTPCGALLFPERSAPDEALGYGRDVGLMVHGEAAERLGWQVALVEGGGPNQWNREFPGYQALARVSVTPFGPFPLDEIDFGGEPRLGVGLSVNRSVTADSMIRLDPIFDQRAGGELRFAGHGLTAIGEIYLARLRMPDTWTLVDERGIGAYAQAGWVVPGAGIVPAVRFAYLDPDRRVPRNATRSAELGLTALLPDRRTEAPGDHLGHHAKLVTSARLDKRTRAEPDLTLALQAQLAW